MQWMTKEFLRMKDLEITVDTFSYTLAELLQNMFSMYLSCVAVAVLNIYVGILLKYA
jgi:hypothetical protein